MDWERLGLAWAGVTKAEAAALEKEAKEKAEEACAFYDDMYRKRDERKLDDGEVYTASIKRKLSM